MEEKLCLRQQVLTLLVRSSLPLKVFERQGRKLTEAPLVLNLSKLNSFRTTDSGIAVKIILPLLPRSSY